MKKSIVFKGTISEVKNQIENEMMKNYKYVVKELQRNDRNATYDEILEECENDIVEAYKILVDCLDQRLEEFTEEDKKFEEYGFYKELRERL